MTWIIGCGLGSLDVDLDHWMRTWIIGCGLGSLDVDLDVQTLLTINCCWSNNRFQFSKTCKVLTVFNVHPQKSFEVLNLNDRTSVSGLCNVGWGGGVLWGIGWNRSRTKEKVECT